MRFGGGAGGERPSPRARRWALIAGLVGLALIAAGAGLVILLRREGRVPPGPVDRTRLRSASFSTDPGWQGFNNRRLGKCTRTRQAFGPGAGGSLGGLVTRAARPAWSGTPVALDFEGPFAATGRLLVRRALHEPFPGGSAIVGFFNAASRDWRPPNLLAFQLNADPVGGGDYSVSLAYGARDYETDHVNYGPATDHPVGLRFGAVYGWRLAYDPAGASGRGQATLTIPRAGPAIRLALAATARRAGAELDRFGMLNQAIARGRELDLSVTHLALGGGAPASSAAWQAHGSHAAYRDCLTGQPNSFGWTGRRDRRVGGLVSRTDEAHPRRRAFYADRAAHLTLDDRLHAEGSVSLARANSDSATLLGWFRRGTSGRGSAELAPPDFLGLAITGPSRIGQYFSPLVADRRGRVAPDDDTGVVLNPGPTTHRWSLDYEPAAGRAGAITLRLDERRVTWRLPRRLRLTGATFDRFGMRNVERGGSFQVVYFDDLRYTVGAAAPQRRRGHRAKRDGSPRRSGDRRARR